VTLFREKIQISTLLKTEYEVYSHLHKNISFVNEIDPSIGFIDIDRIQFQQVITNLLQNAVKFLDKENSIIRIKAHRSDGFLHVNIEDNGR
jgi:signal transduction histidine kinase